MELLDTYLANNYCNLYRDEEAHEIYMKNITLCQEICGEQMSDQLDSLVETYVKDEEPEAILLLITNIENKPIAIFHGTIEDGKLTSNITCSTTELKKGGVLLRFYALLIANRLDPEITEIIGGIEGGIPPLMEDDSDEVIQKKQKKLHDYHFKNGATIYENKFTYKLGDVQDKIIELFTITLSGGKKRKIKKRKTIKRKISKKRRQYSRRK